MQGGEQVGRGALFGHGACGHTFHQRPDRQRVQALLLAETPHRITAVARLYQQALLAQRRQCLPDGGAGNGQALGQGRFGDAFARGKGAAQDQFA
ncbi:hypothetical protein CFBP7900_35280 [Xanthomonas hortorum pv. carotae]|uniref:Uncharacterized protein n=1 Tax=Xanthomonas hortorum pv. carotae TaxID=487904 RepID=A0A6V7FD81_9XANT|nr:hypothetical protein CFBP7900_35280 [Xanthomonas hortorum pv. carotae]CAD0361603.1 hypothetical protein CFBP7900_35280 [Xanthomonas hortorum pv. carotae]